MRKIYPPGNKKLFGKATKKQSDKEFSIIPYHSACPCEYPGVVISASGEPRLRSLCVQASFHTLAGTSFRTEKTVAEKPK